jgi:xylulokinase
MSDGDLYLGLDVGTTGVKAIVFDADGTAHGRGSANFQLRTPRPGIYLQDALDWQAGIRHAVQAACASVPSGQIKALAVSAQGGALVPLDASLEPMAPVRSWLDRRAGAAAATFERIFGRADFYARTGWPIAPNNTAAQILDLRYSEPNVFARARYFCDTAAYVTGWLTGTPAMDTNVAGITQLTNVNTETWDRDILATVGVSPIRLPLLVRPGARLGHLSAAAAKQLGLSRSVLVAGGAHDQYCAALGGGAVGAGDLLISTGTAWVLLAVADGPHPDPKAAIGSGRHLVAGRWGHFGEVANGGVSLEWARQLLAQGERPLELAQVGELVKGVEAGADGLSFFPHFDGTSPFDSTGTSRGSLLGLSLGHGSAHMLRAVMEGVAMSTRLMLESYERSLDRSPGMPVVVGGATRSSTWMQLLADVLGRALRVVAEPDAACVGAAILASVACGDVASVEEGTARMASSSVALHPDDGVTNAYEALFASYVHNAQQLTRLYAGDGPAS